MRNPADRRDVVGTCARRRPPTSSAALAAPPRQRRAGRRRARPSARRDARARRRPAGGRHAAPARRCSCARPARPAPTRVAEVREAVDFLRYYAAQVRARLRQRDAHAARAGGLHQPVELPARDLHRPGRRRAGRRQPGARQAGRADAAGRRRGGARCCMRPACRAPRCSCCRDAARPSARRWSADARVAGRDLHRLDRGRAAAAEARSPAASARAGRPVPLIAETGGQNAMIVDSSALAEQVVADVRQLGVRQRRPALLGAARAVRAGRWRRPHPRDARRARCASSRSATRRGSPSMSAR